MEVIECNDNKYINPTSVRHIIRLPFEVSVVHELEYRLVSTLFILGCGNLKRSSHFAFYVMKFVLWLFVYLCCSYE